MIEVIASYDLVDNSKPDSFVRGYILLLDKLKGEMSTDENMYTDKYSFVLHIMKEFGNNHYKWNSINIHLGSRVIEMKGEKCYEN